MFYRFTILAFCIFEFLSSLEYGIDYKAQGDIPITHLQVFAERASGSNFVEALVAKNFDLKYGCYGHKHFPPWFNRPQEDYLGPRRYYSFEDNENHLFIVVVRHPLDWLRSLHRVPHHASLHFLKLTFSQFLREPWVLDYNDKEVMRWGAYDPYMDRDPLTGKPFDNILKLRTGKLCNMMAIKERVKNYYLLNYEKVRDHPEEVLLELFTLFNLRLKFPYEPVDDYQGNQKIGAYSPKIYPPISDQDLDFIHQELDQNLELSLGYNVEIL